MIYVLSFLFALRPSSLAIKEKVLASAQFHILQIMVGLSALTEVQLDSALQSSIHLSLFCCWTPSLDDIFENKISTWILMMFFLLFPTDAHKAVGQIF